MAGRSDPTYVAQLEAAAAAERQEEEKPLEKEDLPQELQRFIDKHAKEASQPPAQAEPAGAARQAVSEKEAAAFVAKLRAKLTAKLREAPGASGEGWRPPSRDDDLPLGEDPLNTRRVTVAEAVDRLTMRPPAARKSGPAARPDQVLAGVSARFKDINV